MIEFLFGREARPFVALLAVAFAACGESRRDAAVGTGGATAGTGGVAAGAGGVSAAGGSAGRAGSGGSVGSSGFGGRAGSAGASGGSPAGQGGLGDAGAPSSCDEARPDEPCDSEGTACGAESCTSACSFCNILRCEGGVWQRLEAPPAPCFDCGTSARCEIGVELCRIDRGAMLVEACEPLPVTCQRDLTCECLERTNADYTCTEPAAGEFTLERCCG